jgi:transposase-like protein
MDETYIKVAGQWKYLYRAVDRDGDTIDFLLRAKRDRAAARQFLERAIDLHGVALRRSPLTVCPEHERKFVVLCLRWE